MYPLSVATRISLAFIAFIRFDYLPLLHKMLQRKPNISFKLKETAPWPLFDQVRDIKLPQERKCSMHESQLFVTTALLCYQILISS